EEDLIGIPFPNHSSDVLCSLNEQRRDGLLCDVVLIVRDQEYRTHRSVLAACSQYFKKLFTVATTDGGDPHHTAAVYEIDFVAPESLTAILEFAYTSTLTVTASNVKEILTAAQMLEIPCIINVCLEIMDNNVSERSLQSLESRGEQTPLGTEDSSPPSTSTYQGQLDQLSQSQSPDNIRDKTVKQSLQFSPDRKIQSTHALIMCYSYINRHPLKDSVGFLMQTSSLRDILFPTSSLLEPSRPLDLAVKREIIKEEIKEEVPPSLLQEFVSSGLGGTINAGSASSESHIKDEADIRSYLSFLSSASHLGALFPPWQLEEERKMKPKASQQCPICNKVIQGAGKLPRHMRTHTGEKPYMCTICEVRFTRQDKLKIHMRKHTGERPYICLHCNSKFVHNYDLKNHLRIHTGVRPYQCEHCYKSFTRSDHLHRHIKRQSCRISRPRRGRKPSA
uniref:Zinc finger and BTB domain containing 7C n=1 Tax=Poecilia formosa TaxID=48698 RepID=A0A096M0U8_POEFO